MVQQFGKGQTVETVKRMVTSSWRKGRMVYKSFKDMAVFHRASQKMIYVLIYSPKSMEHTKP